MTGDPGYSILVLRQLGAFLFLFAFNGYIQYYFNLPPRGVYILCWVGLGLHGVMASFLSRHHLRTDEGPAWLRRLIASHVLLNVLMAASSFWTMPYLTFSMAAVAIAMDAASFLAVGYLNFRQGYRTAILFVLSRMSSTLGNCVLLAHVLFVWHTLLLESCFMTLYLLDPILLILMMIPDTRRRFKNYFSLEDKETSYETLSERDSVTGLYNKANLLAFLDDSVRSAQNTCKPLAFIVMDIDNFQEYNNIWGYPEGDKLLVSLAKLTRQCLRESDIAARHGGGEFGIVLPGGTMPSAVLVAERIRQTFEKQTANHTHTATLSLGLSFLRQGDAAAAIIGRAYEALYMAKNNGRNRTEFETSA
jgi:diguanylate cyclase (GGDEF)-like protein